VGRRYGCFERAAMEAHRKAVCWQGGRPVDGANNRMFVEAVLWMLGPVRRGAIYRTFLAVKRFRTLQPVERRRCLAAHFTELADDPDFEY